MIEKESISRKNVEREKEYGEKDHSKKRLQVEGKKNK